VTSHWRAHLPGLRHRLHAGSDCRRQIHDDRSQHANHPTSTPLSRRGRTGRHLGRHAGRQRAHLRRLRGPARRCPRACRRPSARWQPSAASATQRVGDDGRHDCDLTDPSLGRPIFATFFAFAYVVPLFVIAVLSLLILAHLANQRTSLVAVRSGSRQRRVTRLLVLVILVFAVACCI